MSKVRVTVLIEGTDDDVEALVTAILAESDDAPVETWKLVEEIES